MQDNFSLYFPPLYVRDQCYAQQTLLNKPFQPLESFGTKSCLIGDTLRVAAESI